MTSMIKTIVPIDISVSKFFGGQSPHENKLLVEQKFHYAFNAKSGLENNDLAVEGANRTALIGLSVGLCDQPTLRRLDDHDPPAGRLGSRTG
jgi:hypothetical protein